MTEPIQEPVDADAAPDEGEPAESVAAPEPSEEEQEAEEEHEAAEAPEEPADEPPQAFTEKEWEQASDKLKREAKRHWDRVAEIMGVEMRTLTACPMCDPDVPGAVMLTPAVPERFPAVREFMGDAQPRELQRDPKTETCGACEGEGVLDTGSKVTGQNELACWNCGGKGWVGERGPVALPAPVVTATPVPTNGPPGRSVTHEEQAVIEELRAKGIVVYVPPAPPAPVP